jgi:hypothetical protein
MKKNRFENLLSIIGLCISILLLFFTSILALYTGYSQKKLIDEAVIEKNNIQKPNHDSVLQRHENKILKLFGYRRNDYSSDDYEKILVFNFHALLLLTSVYTSIFAFIAYARYRRNLKRNQSLQSFSINNDDHEDLKIMLQYYKGADYVTVYSGDFSWLKDNVELQKVVLNLAASSKIKLCSSKSRAIVEGKIGPNILTELEKNHLITFEKDNKSNIRCSLVEYSGEHIFLYKIKTAHPPNGLKYTLCILSEKNDSKYLLKTIVSLMKRD